MHFRFRLHICQQLQIVAKSLMDYDLLILKQTSISTVIGKSDSKIFQGGTYLATKLTGSTNLTENVPIWDFNLILYWSIRRLSKMKLISQKRQISRFPSNLWNPSVWEDDSCIQTLSSRQKFQLVLVNIYFFTSFWSIFCPGCPQTRDMGPGKRKTSLLEENFIFTTSFDKKKTKTKTFRVICQHPVQFSYIIICITCL